MNFYGRDLFAYHFISKKESYLDHLAFLLLSSASNWVKIDELSNSPELSYYSIDFIRFRLSELIDLHFIVEKGTKESEIDEQYESKWVWGPTAGYYHFGIKDPYYMNPKETMNWLDYQVKVKPDIPLYQTNKNCDKIISLPKPELTSEIFNIMRNRRSYRGFDETEKITIQELQQCLFSGLGITGFIKTPMAELAPLPMKMTPSGGGRNPFEAYVYVQHVKDLPKGIYHYSGFDHTLGLIQIESFPSIGAILANQPWFDNAGALILLVANFERTMWKYPHPTGFRVVILEAGHIAQNLLLAATALGLASAPTCAVSDALIQKLLRLDPISQSVVHTVSIGKKSSVPTVADVVKIIPNPHYEIANL